MNKYQYATSGGLATIEAGTPEEALALAKKSPDRLPTSGVSLYTETPTPNTPPATIDTTKRVDRTGAIGALQTAEDNARITKEEQDKIRREADLYASDKRQARIDAINTAFAPRIQRQSEENLGNISRVQALNFSRGIVGSGADTTKLGEQKGLNEKALRALEDEKSIAINEAFGYADQLARERAEQLTAESQGIARSNVEFYKNQADRALEAIKMFGKTGSSFEEIEKADPNTINTLREVSGLSDLQIKSLLASSAPEGTYQWNQAKSVGNQMYVPKVVNGKVVLETLELPYNAGKAIKDTVKSGENVYIIYEDGTTKLLGGGGGGFGGGGNTYTNDLDAILGATLSTIPTKFGQGTFQSQISKARDDSDKINLVASQVLKGQPAEFKRDFSNQAVGIKELDKAIAEIDKGVQTGVVNNALQYTFNVLGKDYDPKLAKIQSYITAAIQPYRNSVTGAAWGQQEDGEYASLFGSTKYSPTELRQRLVQVKELLKSKSAEGLNAFVNPLGYYDNPFNVGGLGTGKTLQDYRAEFPQANEEELQALMAEEQGL